MYGLGVLIIGDSGVGKSESALELIARGHRFISDDVVQVRRGPRGRLIGRAPSISRHFMEIRGLGIINIREIFGPRSIALESPIDLVIRLKKWHRKKEFDRLGLRFPEDTPHPGRAHPPAQHPRRARPEHRHPDRGGLQGPPSASGAATPPRSISAQARPGPRPGRRGRTMMTRRPVPDHHRAVRLGQDRGQPLPRGPRLLLRRQPARPR